MAMVIRRHCSGIKTLENVTLQNLTDKGQVQNNDI